MKVDKLTKLLLLAIVILLGVIVGRPMFHVSTAEAGAGSFGHIRGLTMSPMVGFWLLDSKSGKVYLYNPDKKEAIEVGQLPQNLAQ